MTPSLPLVGEDFAGYLVRGVLGRGGMSVVYEAENARLGNTVALKVLAPELSTDDTFRARFLKESRLAASLNHPNVIPIYDSGPCDGMLYIAMRYVAGSDLRTILNTHERISPGEALALIGQAGRALDAAHRLGLVHRDVKPANVLIEPGEDDDPDHVYIADFGITKHTLSRSGLTATGQLVGTIDYIAPEQIQGKPLDGRADIYSLGCVLYECLTGQVPFVKDLDAAVIWAHVEEPPTPPSAIRAELPRAIDEVMLCALAKDPNDRYQTCRDFVAAARAALAPVAGTSLSPAPGGDIPAGSPTVLSAEHVPQQAPAPPPPAGPERESAAARGAEVPAAGAAGRQPAPASGRPPGRDRADRRSGRRWYAALLAAVLVGGVVAIVLVSSSSTAKQSGQLASSALAQVPTNHVTGSGKATVALNGNVATVTVTTSDLDYGDELVHAMHIHAGGKGECPPASAARPHNGHQTISTDDGLLYYGDAVEALTTHGDTSPSSILALRRFPTGGSIHYRRTITLPASVAAYIRENNAVVVVHGIDYDDSGGYTGVLERSELNKTLPATETAPALCGVLLAQPRTASLKLSSHGHAAVFSASLSVNAASSMSPGEMLLCQVGEAAAAAGEPRRSTSEKTTA